MKEQKIQVTQSSLPSFEEYVEKIKGIWNSHWLTNMGPLHSEFEEALKEKLKIDNISLFTNGHLALELTLQAFDLTGEVITTPFTFASTTHAIVRNDLTPVFCDINPKDFTMDVNKIKQLITDKTTAIVPVHVYGNLCDVERIQEIADKHGLKVIYDAAHAFNVWYKGKSSASFGDASMFSFHATKVFNTIEGGAVAFKNPKFGEILYRLKNFGIKDAEHVAGVGSNAKMNEFQAAMGICNLKYLDNEIMKRKRIVEIYNNNLALVKGLQILSPQKDVKSNYAYYPIVINETIFGKDRNYVHRQLQEHGIFTRKYFYPLTNEYECYANNFEVQKTPVAQKIANQVLTLPLYAELEEKVAEEICGLIKAMKEE